MNSEKQFLNFVNENISFIPNYNLIKSRIDEENLNHQEQIHSVERRRVFWKSLRLAIYTICICIISIVSTLLIQNYISGQSTGDVSPGKLDAAYLEENFDTFVAFGGGSRNMFSVDLLLNSNLINEEDKKVLSDYNSTCKGNKYYNLYLGVKDGKDIVEFHHLSKPYKILQFSSNLNYSFEAIIQEFEELSGEQLSKEFLYESNSDALTGEETLGIVVEFKRNENGVYSIYFKTTLNGKVYTIDK